MDFMTSSSEKVLISVPRLDTRVSEWHPEFTISWSQAFLTILHTLMQSLEKIL